MLSFDPPLLAELAIKLGNKVLVIILVHSAFTAWDK